MAKNPIKYRNLVQICRKLIELSTESFACKIHVHTFTGGTRLGVMFK